jgi:hypothetical protein
MKRRIADALTVKEKKVAFLRHRFGSWPGSDPVIDRQPLTETTSNKRVKGNSPPPSHRVFVGGLPAGIGTGELVQYFERFGPVQDAIIPTDTLTGENRGFAFIQIVEFASVEVAFVARPAMACKRSDLANMFKSKRPPMQSLQGVKVRRTKWCGPRPSLTCRTRAWNAVSAFPFSSTTHAIYYA